MQSATIKIFLVNGSPNGLRTAELSNWSGKAIAAPRTEIADIQKRDELNSPGFYILTGVDPDSGDRAIYVGEAENVSNRLKGHSGKDFWNAVTVFVSKDENLTKAHIRYLEGKLLDLANGNSTSIVMNSASSGARLPESDAAEMDVYLEKCLQLMPVLGVSDFNLKVEREATELDFLYCKIKGVVAKGRRTQNGFIVFKGSQAVLAHRPSAKRMRVKREQLIEKGYLKEQDGFLLFTRDLEFGSPSTAGSIVRGGNSNGLTCWKNSKGTSLKDLENEE
ncbi:MAG: GIY-YIG nuclease family protein [Verrucomicrobiota bacterium]